RRRGRRRRRRQPEGHACARARGVRSRRRRGRARRGPGAVRLMRHFLVTGGTVIDGSGDPPRDADIRVEDGRIAEIGDLAGRDDLPALDAPGLTVTPGFIDIHSHSDYTLLEDPRAVSAIFQGVTLEVVGNCGFGCFPIRDRAAAATAIY